MLGHLWCSTREDRDELGQLGRATGCSLRMILVGSRIPLFPNSTGPCGQVWNRGLAGRMLSNCNRGGVATGWLVSVPCQQDTTLILDHFPSEWNRSPPIQLLFDVFGHSLVGGIATFRPTPVTRLAEHPISTDAEQWLFVFIEQLNFCLLRVIPVAQQCHLLVTALGRQEWPQEPPVPREASLVVGRACSGQILENRSFLREIFSFSRS